MYMFTANAFIRDSCFGRLIYHLSNHRYFYHPEESFVYEVPLKYLIDGKQEKSSQDNEIENKTTDESESSSNNSVEYEDQLEDDEVLVTWDGDDDPENPQNWPVYYKIIFVVQISLLTAIVYIALTIYTPGVTQLQQELGVGQVVALLPVTLFACGSAFGPLLFSPLTENASVGRTLVYIVTLFIFFILQIPTALVKNIAGLCILRFLGGFFASPCLATGGASILEVIRAHNLPTGLSVWSLGAIPGLGPLIGSALIVGEDYRFTFWFLCMFSGVLFLVLGFTLPETYERTLLHRKAVRLRAKTGNSKIISKGEVENRVMTIPEKGKEFLFTKPLEITLCEPTLLLINFYTFLVNGVQCLFFESITIYFQQIRLFTTAELGAAWTSAISGVVLANGFYSPYMTKYFTKPVSQHQLVFADILIPMAILGSVLCPIGLFIFGWTAIVKVHWIVPLIGVAIYSGGLFLILQTLYDYLGASFKVDYAASVFASNNLFRSLSASGFPLLGNMLFNNLATPNYPVGWGSSVLGFISIILIAVPVLIWHHSSKLRTKSKYANVQK